MPPPFSDIGKKSRLRRTTPNKSGRCPNPTAGGAAADIPSSSAGEGGDGAFDPAKVDEVIQKIDPETRQRLDSVQINPDHNPYCFLLTAGILPWGVCSSGNDLDEILLADRMVFPSYSTNPTLLYQLNHATLGEPPIFRSFFSSFPFPLSPFCFRVPPPPFYLYGKKPKPKLKRGRKFPILFPFLSNFYETKKSPEKKLTNFFFLLNSIGLWTFLSSYPAKSRPLLLCQVLRPRRWRAWLCCVVQFHEGVNPNPEDSRLWEHQGGKR